jgi:hypothetical protein
MKGYLQRLAARALGHDAGLRPRTPLLFEPGAADAPEAMAQEADGGPRAAAPALDAGQPLPGVKLSVAPARRDGDDRPRASAPERTGPVATARAITARTDTPAPLPVAGIRVREQGPVGPVTAPIAATPQAPLLAPGRVGDRPRDGSPVQEPLPGIRPRPRSPGNSPWTLETAVPRVVGGDGTRASAGRREGRDAGTPPPEQVVRVTIERLDVHADAPPPKPPRRRPAETRRDTLADYARRRREAKR